MRTRLSKEVTAFTKHLRIAVQRTVLRSADKPNDQIRQVAYVHVVTLRQPRPDDGDEALRQRKPDHAGHRHAPRVPRAPASAVDGRRAHDGGPHGGRGGRLDELVDVAVDGRVREGEDGRDVGYVVVFVVWVRGLAEALLANVALGWERGVVSDGWRGGCGEGQERYP